MVTAAMRLGRLLFREVGPDGREQPLEILGARAAGLQMRGHLRVPSLRS